jgi:drug/metabolite transporter (DMT)-like permease
MKPRWIYQINERPYLLLTMAVFFWSFNFILGRAVRSEIPPVALAFWRWTGATLILCPMAWRHFRRDWPLVKKNWPILILLSALGVAVFNTLVYMGLQWTTALNAFIMQSAMPVIIVALSFLIFKETVTVMQCVGISLSLLGALAIVTRGDAAVFSTMTLDGGDLLVLLAVICYAGYSVALRRRPAIHPLCFVLITFSLGSLMLLPFYLIESLGGRPMPLNQTALLSVGYVMVFPSIVSYLCYNRGVELVGANRGGLFLHLMPVFGSIMAILFLDESIYWFHVAGICLIALGIGLVTHPRRKS